MAAAFINQVPASSYGFDFRYTHGWAFLYRITSPPLLWQGWGREEVQSGPLARPFFDFGVPSLLFNVHSTVNQKTPGSLEACGCVV